MFAFGDILSTEQTHNFKLAYGKSLRIMFLISIQNIFNSEQSIQSYTETKTRQLLYQVETLKANLKIVG